ncbi:signal-transduction protein [Anopheles sinensis]|uniref:Signal-transduction protein n=1 Tax=Anopheles sinensis TaxID=74873 RepID=A0A084VS23_ANOSI|nr:signal-transduction protein [Anopheles sinensis]
MSLFAQSPADIVELVVHTDENSRTLRCLNGAGRCGVLRKCGDSCLERVDAFEGRREEGEGYVATVEAEENDQHIKCAP